MHPVGVFYTFKIENTTFKTDIHVLKDDSLAFDAIFGQDCIQQTEFSYGQCSVKLIEKVISGDTFLSYMTVFGENSSPNLDQIKDTKRHAEVTKLIDSYQPRKTISTDR